MIWLWIALIAAAWILCGILAYRMFRAYGRKSGTWAAGDRRPVWMMSAITGPLFLSMVVALWLGDIMHNAPRPPNGEGEPT